MKTILFILTLFAANIDYAQDHGINGFVWDHNTDEPASGAIVFAENDLTHEITSSQPNGGYHFCYLRPGTYTLSFYYRGEHTASTIVFTVDSLNHTETELPIQQLTYSRAELVISYPSFRYGAPENPLLQSNELLKSVNKFQLQQLAEGMSSKLIETSSGELSVRGGTNNQLQFIDGVKSREFHSAPSASLRKLTVYDGFIPANYGDVTGSVIVTETLSYFDLLNEWEKQQ